MIYATLIQHGHPPDLLTGYTQRQLLLHYECIEQLNRLRRAERLVDLNHAFAGGKEATDLLKKLLP